MWINIIIFGDDDLTLFGFFKWILTKNLFDLIWIRIFFFFKRLQIFLWRWIHQIVLFYLIFPLKLVWRCLFPDCEAFLFFSSRLLKSVNDLLWYSRCWVKVGGALRVFKVPETVEDGVDFGIFGGWIGWFEVVFIIVKKDLSWFSETLDGESSWEV